MCIAGARRPRAPIVAFPPPRLASSGAAANKPIASASWSSPPPRLATAQQQRPQLQPLSVPRPLGTPTSMASSNIAPAGAAPHVPLQQIRSRPPMTTIHTPLKKVPTHKAAAPHHGHSSRRNKHDLRVDHAYHDHSYDAPTDEKHVTRGGVTEPFPIKLHRMLDAIERDGYKEVVGWMPHGRCFVVHKPKEFVEIVMPKYFKQTKFASFQRQLNLYGFSRLTAGLDRGGYYHELFLRGKSFLAHRIYRMRVKGTRVRMASSPDSEPDFYGMPPLCAGVGPCSVRGCCGVRHQGPHHPPPPPHGLLMSPGAAPAPPPTPAPVSSSTGSMFRPPGAQPYQVATPPQSCQPCQPPPPLQQQQQPLQQQQPYQPPPSPMTSAQYGSPLPPPSMQQQPQMQQPPPMQQPLQPQSQQLQPAPPTAVAASPSPAMAPQVPQEPMAATVTPTNARPSLSSVQPVPYAAQAAPQTAAAEVAQRRDEVQQAQLPQPQPQPQLLPRPVFRPAPTPAAPAAVPSPAAPASHHPRHPHHHRPPQQMGAIVEDDGDSDIDEVLFEGKVFHYLKPFPHHSPSSSPSRRIQQRPVMQLATAAGVNDDDHDVPALPESVASYDAADEEEERRRRLWMTMQQQQAQAQQHQGPAIVPGSPPAAIAAAQPQAQQQQQQQQCAAPPMPASTPVVALCPLPPPPPLDNSSMFETASRLAEIVYRRERPSEEPRRAAEPETKAANSVEPPRPDCAPSSAEADSGDLKMPAAPIAPVVKDDAACTPKADVVPSTAAAPAVSDDEQQQRQQGQTQEGGPQGITPSSSAASLSRVEEEDEQQQQQRQEEERDEDIDCEQEGDGDLERSYVRDDDIDDYDSENCARTLPLPMMMNEDKINAEMDSFFATLDEENSPLDFDEEMNSYLADDTNFGYMIEKVLE